MAYPNGQIPLSDLVMTTAGVRLRSDAAASYERLSKEFNKVHGPMYVSDGYRARNDGGNFSQEAIFFDRYRPQASGNGPFNDVRWYNGKRYVRHKGAAAAVPGTSNHGWGVAADFASGINSSFTSPQYRWMAQNGPSHGWTNTEGRGINEPWHWVYNPANDQYRNSGGGNTARPEPTPPVTAGPINTIGKNMLLNADTYRARGVLGVLCLNGAFAEITNKGEFDNLRKAGVPYADVTDAALNALIKDGRGQYATVAVRNK